MKTKIEFNDYQIEIEENDGFLTVKAEKDGDVIEEFTLGNEEAQPEGEEVQGFEEFGSQEAQEEAEEETQEESEEEAQDDFEEQDDFEDDSEVTGVIESFGSFMKRRK